MNLKPKEDRTDGQLKEALSNLNKQIDVLHDIESQYLEVDGNKKAVLAELIVAQSSESFSMREARALASPEWRLYCERHAEGEADYNRARRRYELLLKAFDAAYLSLKTETATIRRSVDG